MNVSMNVGMFYLFARLKSTTLYFCHFQIKEELVKKGILIPLPKYDNCFLARTDPKVSYKSRVINQYFLVQSCRPETLEIYSILLFLFWCSFEL